MNKNTIFKFLVAIVFLVQGVFANTLYINAKVFTGDKDKLYVDTFLVKDKKFKFIGKKNEALKFTNKDTKIIDLQGKRVIPALYDSHLHPIGAGTDLLFKCNFPQTSSIKEIQVKMRKCVSKAPKGSWITGVRWGAELLDKVHYKYLDEVSKDHYLVLTDFSNHNAWVNSKVIEVSNIDEEAIIKYGELIGKDQNGKPNGLLKEDAQKLYRSIKPSHTSVEMDKALVAAKNILHSNGIIGIKDSYAYEPEINTYLRAEKNNSLNLRVGVVFGWKKEGESLEAKKQRLLKMKSLETPYIKTNFIKLSIDGIPPTKTAALIEPYLEKDHSHGNNFGILEFNQEELNKVVQWADENGFSVMTHSSGDMAVRQVLNAIEYTRDTNKNSKLQHELAHACMVHTNDIKRFRELNAVANFSPFFWFPSPIHDGMKMLFGEKRANAYCATKTLIDEKTKPTYGTDWPVVEAVNPFTALESFVTRKDPYGRRGNETVWKEEAVSIEKALEMYTINGAIALGIENESGTISKGKTADFIVLNQDIFTINPDSIGDTKVELTVFDGKTIYKKQGNKK